MLDSGYSYSIRYIPVYYDNNKRIFCIMAMDGTKLGF
jgi:hypothetical protein